MSTDQKAPATLRELIARATPGPWHVVKCGTPEMFHHVHGVACIGDHFVEADKPQGNEACDAQLIARCSPSVLLRVVEALERSADWLKELADDGNAADWVITNHSQREADLRQALSLLNGGAP